MTTHQQVTMTTRPAEVDADDALGMACDMFTDDDDTNVARRLTLDTVAKTFGNASSNARSSQNSVPSNAREPRRLQYFFLERKLEPTHSTMKTPISLSHSGLS